jgi:predicted DNA-binding transcriptional regulator YafY
LRFGAEAEVLEPPELRTRMAEVAVGMDMIYRK